MMSDAALREIERDLYRQCPRERGPGSVAMDRRCRLGDDCPLCGVHRVFAEIRALRRLLERFSAPKMADWGSKQVDQTGIAFDDCHAYCIHCDWIGDFDDEPQHKPGCLILAARAALRTEQEGDHE